ncbi:prolyl oligopeptidase family serine peptidase [Massilia sp. HP4]|uniref:prolyl oligopeptidase family serine peptidase n=1 Tax=Massilia sp. HP4 TaxID=2562316 RepID=UPI0014858286|nr:prolyl oligopeptidase family serine peptidase [Massilia sp. HP4]
MIKRRHLLVSAAALAAGALAPALAAGTRPRPWPLPPQHRRVPRDVGGLGYHRMDDYSWFQPRDWHAVLRAPDALDAPIKAAIELENAYTDAMLAPSAPLQEALIARIAQLDAIAGAPIDNPRFGESVSSPDGRYLYWTGRSGKDGPLTVLRREIGKPGDTLIHEENDPALSIGLRTTAAGGYLVIRMASDDMTELRLVPMDRPTAAPLLVEPRTPGLHYDVDEWNGRLLVLTDADGALDFKLMTACAAAPGRAHWTPLVAHEAGRFITAVHPFAGYLVREEMRDALPRLVVMAPDGTEREVAFAEAAYTIGVPARQDWDAPAMAFDYQSPRSPRAAFTLDLASARCAPAGPPLASAAFDRERYEVRRLCARAEDGALVPLTVTLRKGQQLDGSAPLLMNAYGAYGISIDAAFHPAVIALVEQGFIHVIAHVRGGAERGTQWSRAALKQGKKKTFTDFIACAEHLIAERYTRQGRIVAYGMSAGGLLVGAVCNMRPELWAGAIAQVPFVDVLTSIEHYEDHPLGTTPFPYWGDPRVPEEHAYMASYSPYDRLRPAPYPALLALGSVNDDMVAFWEPLKFAVKARSLTTAGNPILSRTLTHAGHMGDPDPAAQRAQHALFIAFAVWAADRKWGQVPQRPA